MEEERERERENGRELVDYNDASGWGSVAFVIIKVAAKKTISMQITISEWMFYYETNTVQ